MSGASGAPDIADASVDGGSAGGAAATDGDASTTDASDDGGGDAADGGPTCKPASLLDARYRLKTISLVENATFSVGNYTPVHAICPITTYAGGWLELSSCDGSFCYQTASITLDRDALGFDGFPGNRVWTFEEVGSTATEVRLVSTFWSTPPDQSSLEIRIDRATGTVTDLNATYFGSHPGTGWNIAFDAKGAPDCGDGGSSPSVAALPEPQASLLCMFAGTPTVPPFPNGNDSACYYETGDGEVSDGVDCDHVLGGSLGTVAACGGARKVSCTNTPGGTGFTAVCCND